MPPARRSTTKKTTARASGAAKTVRARAGARSAATRREVEQSIARFEKRLDDANDALKTLGGHLGRGAQGSYKELTSTLTALRREASKTNKQALKDFDSLRAAITQKASATKKAASKKTSRAKSSTAKASTSAKKSTAKRSTAKRSTATRSTAKRSTTKRSTGTRARKTS